MEPNSGGATYPLARGAMLELASLSIWGLLRVMLVAAALLALRILRLLPRAAWPIAQAWVSCDHWMQYRAQVEAMELLNDHLRKDVGLPSRNAVPEPFKIWDTL